MFFSRRQFLWTTGLGLPGLFIPEEVLAWGAFREFAATHKKIVTHAYYNLGDDPAMKVTGFPIPEEIVKHDMAYLPSFGTGPDVDGKSFYSQHYYNPITRKGNGPSSVAIYFGDMVSEIRKNPNSETSARWASWAAHFIADMHVPYHVLGFPNTEAFERYKQRNWIIDSADCGPLRMYSNVGLSPSAGWGKDHNFKYAIVDFCQQFPPKIFGRDTYVDWFDPWYYNGHTYGIVKDVTGSHQIWEAFAHRWWDKGDLNIDIDSILNSEQRWDPFWKNIHIRLGKLKPKLVKDNIERFAHECANETRNFITDVYDRPAIGIAHAIRAVMTLYRAGMTALDMGYSVRRKRDGRYKISCRVTNTANEKVTDVYARCVVRISGQKSRGKVKWIGSLTPKQSGHQTWELYIDPGQKRDFLLDICGFYENTPDYGYNRREFSLKGGEPYPVPAHSLIVSDFGFGDGTPFQGKKVIEGVRTTLVSINTEPYLGSSFRNKRTGKTATVTFRFSKLISEFHLKVSRVQYDEFLNGFNIGNPTSLSGDLIRKNGKITVTRDKGDYGTGNLIWTGINTTVVRFNIGGPKGTALAVDQFAILPAP